MKNSIKHTKDLLILSMVLSYHLYFQIFKQIILILKI